MRNIPRVLLISIGTKRLKKKFGYSEDYFSHETDWSYPRGWTGGNVDKNITASANIADFA